MTSVNARLLNSSDLMPAVDALRRGDVVGMPTETVYGLAGNAFNVNAVTKIFAAKERPSFDPLIVHVSDKLNSVGKLSEASIIDPSRMTAGMTKITERLITAFWPGPLTIILPKHSNIPDLVTSGLDRVGVRMPAHPVAQSLLRESGLPLAAPSANRFGRISPTTADHVRDELGDRIPFIIDGGECEIGVESTVVTIDDDRIYLLRPGKISSGDLSSCAGVPVEKASAVLEKASPGMLASHYAPRKPMYLVQDWTRFPESLLPKLNDKFAALLVTSGYGELEIAALERLGIRPAAVARLSETGHSGEAAHELFAAMRDLDGSAADIILASAPTGDDGLWLAIADRMRRASTNY